MCDTTHFIVKSYINKATGSSAANTALFKPCLRPALIAKKSTEVYPTVVDIIFMIRNERGTHARLLTRD